MGNTFEAKKQQTAEVMIDATVYDNAGLRAEAQGESLTSVCRMVLFQAAARATPMPGSGNSERPRMPGKREHRKPEDHVTSCPLRDNVRGMKPRPRCACDVRLRYRIPRDAYQTAKAAIHDAGGSVTEVLERGLRHYAATGQVLTVLL